MSSTDLCTCGHAREAHEHYRAGSDCSLCPETCARFRAAAPLGVRLLSWLRGGRLETIAAH